MEAERQVAATASVERRYYLLSAPQTVSRFGRAVRSHWGIENQVHWVLDMTFGEDACRVLVEHGAQNFAVLRHLALNLLRQERTLHGSLPTKRFTAALDETYLAKVLAPVAADLTRISAQLWRRRNKSWTSASSAQYLRRPPRYQSNFRCAGRHVG